MRNINDLPVEVLENIFIFLPFRQLKLASIVCSLWHRTIFSRANLQNVVLVLMTHKIVNLPITKIETSERSYRSARLIFDNLEVDRQLVLYFLKILQKFSNSLERLEVSWKIYDKPLDLIILEEISKSIPQLKQLTVFDQETSGCDIDPNELLGIAPMKFLEKVRLPRIVMDASGFNLVQFAPNVKNINVVFGKKHPWDAIGALREQLVTVCIKTETTANFGHFWSIKPPKLQKLRLIRHHCDLVEPNDVEVDSVRAFFLFCPVLTVLKLDLRVPLEVLQVIVDSCPQLESLLLCSIDGGWQVLSILSNLKYLQNLSMIAATFHPYESTKLISPLPALRHLTLCASDFLDVSQFFVQLNLTVPILSTLQLIHYSQICDEELNIRTLESLFLSKMPMLKKLVLFDFCCVFPSHLVNQLNLFPRLNELWLTSKGLSPHFESALVPGVRRLAVDAPINQFLLRSLLEVFPSLTRLDVCEECDCLDEQSLRCELNFCEKRSLLEDRVQL
ncbi:uncharacterized protein LOC129717876 [Wyeomyia smithii]|uniref:uncharacterized protein LOC129717876 n=1 Tax=Wyeomyia smithii TaxID=174621 RepID=UPI002467E9A9|nr:uncharacterized protein LOC129717876 [Wyeomyia smithii]